MNTASGRTRRTAPSVAVLVSLLLFAACTQSATGPADAVGTTMPAVPLTFYRPPTVIDHGVPGEILDQQPIALDPSLPATGSKITYVSTTPAGDRVPVTGVLMRPRTAPPATGYPVAVWAHGTTGLGDECAPSAFAPFGVEGAEELLAAGIVVVAPDYEGLGTGEVHPYLVGVASGHNVLDAARAASAVGGNHTVVAWGHSQGGHAVLFARTLASTYAPELDVRGVAAAAPVTDVAAFLIPGLEDANIFPFTAEAVIAWDEVYEQLSLDKLLDPAYAEQARLLRQACTGDIAAAAPTVPTGVVDADPQTLDEWGQAARLNSATAGSTLMPTMLTHGDADTLVPVAGTVALQDALCANRVASTLVRDPTWNHTTALLVPLQQITAWLRDRIAGTPAPSGCPKS